MFGPRRREGLGITLLLMQLYQVGFNRIPPVTLATIAANVGIYLRVFKMFNIPTIQKACVSTFYVWHRKEWSRMFWGSLIHADEWHLYYNMASFLWKGLTLEKKFGSVYFAFMLAVFSFLTNVTLVGLNILLEHITENSAYISDCAAGFSGVIFALKVVTTDLLPPGIQYVMGMFPVPSRYVVWAELIIIQILVPNASFTGHLAGILVGLLYIKGPLKGIMNSFVPTADTRYIRSGRMYTYQSGTATSGNSNTRQRAEQQNTARQRQQPNTAYESEQEQLDRALWASRLNNVGHTASAPPVDQSTLPAEPPTTNAHAQHSSQSQPDLEDIRQRRLARFAQNR